MNANPDHPMNRNCLMTAPRHWTSVQLDHRPNMSDSQIEFSVSAVQNSLKLHSRFSRLSRLFFSNRRSKR